MHPDLQAGLWQPQQEKYFSTCKFSIDERITCIRNILSKQITKRTPLKVLKVVCGVCH